MRKALFKVLTLTILTSCSSLKNTLDRKLAPLVDSELFGPQHTGFLLIDAQTKDTLFDRNSTKYFVPASNTKIFTLFTSLA